MIQLRVQLPEQTNELLKDAADRYSKQVGIKCSKQDYMVKVLNDAASKEQEKKRKEIEPI